MPEKKNPNYADMTADEYVEAKLAQYPEKHLPSKGHDDRRALETLFFSEYYLLRHGLLEKNCHKLAKKCMAMRSIIVADYGEEYAERKIAAAELTLLSDTEEKMKV
jgi:hypothetical protein